MNQTLGANSVAPHDFVGLPYASALLLDGRFHVSVVADPGFSEACKVGFEGYFDMMFYGSQEPVFVDRLYSVDEVRREVIESVAIAHTKHGERLPWCAGSMLGWLSALALVQYQEAQEGLKELAMLVERFLS